MFNLSKGKKAEASCDLNDCLEFHGTTKRELHTGG